MNVISVWGDSFNDKQDVWVTKIHTQVRIACKKMQMKAYLW